MTVLLNDPSEFTGGEFKMKDHNIKDFEIKLKKGSVLVFLFYKVIVYFPSKQEKDIVYLYSFMKFLFRFSLFHINNNNVTKL
ncbi:MAG: hypothetical protein CM15mV25_0010 [uncultured marine virus]|nr:MAG: hypothetical protein CM15mV25_0010 [uncultured marine virus]